MARKFDDRDDDDEDDRPRRRKKKKKKGKGALIAVLLILGFVVLAGGGVGAYFLFFRGASGDEANDRINDRILGSWKGIAPERPTMTLYMEVQPNRVLFSAEDSKTGKGRQQSYPRTATRLSGKNLVLTMQGADDPFEWSIEFLSDHEIRQRSLTDANTPARTYTRIGKLAAKEQP